MAQFIRAGNLSIAWVQDPSYWQLCKDNKLEIAKLKQVWWFDIEAKVDTKTLCKKAGYTAYLVYDFEDWTTGLDTVKASVRFAHKIGNKDEGYTINLKKKKNPGDKGVFPTTRASDGRLEVELGQFHTNYCDCEQTLIIRVFNIDTSFVKSGIHVVGVELRPY